MAFPLGAIGAGLGKFAEYWTQQQQLAEQRKRNEALAWDSQLQRKLQMAQLEKLATDEKSKQNIGTAIASLYGGGGAAPGGGMSVKPLPGAGGPMGAPPSPGGLNLPGSSWMPQASAGAAPAIGNVANNNFGGMRQPGVPAAGGPLTNPGGWQKFGTPGEGIIGIANQLDRYVSGATTGQPLTTLRQIITTWAPPNENPTEQLIARASSLTGFAPDEQLNWADPAVKSRVIEAIVRNEHGGQLPSPVDPALIGRVVGGVAQPAQMAQAQPGTAPQASAPQTSAPGPVNIPAPPDAFNPEVVFRTLKERNPGMSDRDLLLAMGEVAKHVGPKYENSYKRWHDQAEIALRQGTLGETARSNVARETEAERSARAREADQGVGRGLEGGRLTVDQERAAETARANREREKSGAVKFQAKLSEKQTKIQTGITEAKNLADRARQLQAAVEQNPQLVGAQGVMRRFAGSIFEQAAQQKQDEQIADFKSQLQILQTKLQKPLLDARYFSGPAQERLNTIIPGLGAMDNPTMVKAALRNIAETMEQTAAAAEAAAGAVGQDYSTMSDEALRQMLGLEAPAQ